MANDANIRAVITAEDRASATIKNFGDNVNKVGTSVSRIGSQIAHVAEIAGGAIVGFGALSIKAFSESEDLIAQTNAVLKSTGEIAGVTADQVTKLATSWQKQTKFSDESVRGAENILLTFTKINKDIFPQTLEAVLNLSTAMHEDLQSASVQVGKALQDPILGITALRRVGVNFNDAQKEVVKNLVETGHQAEAQAIILKELQTEFGGSAVAAGDTFAGSLAKLKNQLNDVQESIGKLLIDALEPYMKQLATYISTHGPQIQAMINTFIDTIKTLTIVLHNHWKEIVGVFVAYKSLKIVAEVTTLFRALGLTLGASRVAMGAMGSESLATGSILARGLTLLGPYALAIGAVGAAGFGLYQVYKNLHKSYQDNLEDVKQTMNWTGRYKGSVDLLTLANDRQKDATAAVKQKVTDLTNTFAQTVPLQETVARKAQAVADAQNNVNNALITYGINSPQWQAAVLNLRQKQDDLNNSQLAELGNNLQIQTLEGQLRTARDELAASTGQLASWQDYLNGKYDVGIKLLGTTKDAINLQVIPAINGLIGKIGQVQQTVGVGIQMTGGGNLQGGVNVQGHRAGGGPITSGTPYMVGERGPEVVIPNQNSNVVPNNKIGSTTNLTVNVGVYAGTDIEKRKLAQSLFSALQDAAGSQNKTVSQLMGM